MNQDQLRVAFICLVRAYPSFGNSESHICISDPPLPILFIFQDFLSNAGCYLAFFVLQNTVCWTQTTVNAMKWCNLLILTLNLGFLVCWKRKISWLKTVLLLWNHASSDNLVVLNLEYVFEHHYLSFCYEFHLKNANKFNSQSLFAALMHTPTI